MNRLDLEASVAAIEPLAHTPAGIAIVRVRLEHESQVAEAGSMRRVALALQAVALGDAARDVAALQVGSQVRASGFVAPLRHGSDQLVLHIQQVTAMQHLN